MYRKLRVTLECRIITFWTRQFDTGVNCISSDAKIGWQELFIHLIDTYASVSETKLN